MIWDLHTILMVDPYVVVESTNSSLVRDEPYKHPDNPLLRVDDTRMSVGGRARGGRLHGGLQLNMVVREGGVFRMWYKAIGVREATGGAQKPVKGGHASSTEEERGKNAYLAYAESEDGIEFKPVRVGQVQLDGSRNNNLLLPDAGGEPRVRQCGLFHDPLYKDYPYKCLYYRPGDGKDLEPGVLARYPHLAKRKWWFVWGIGRSKDGIEWQPPRHKHNLINASPEHANLHRAMDGGLVMADQMMSPVEDWSYRNVKGWITYDLETAHRVPDYVYSVAQHMARCNPAYNGPNWSGVPWIQPHIGLRVARKGPSMIALNGFIYGTSGRSGDETYAQKADIGLCVSETGVKFKDILPFRPFIRRGMRGEWDYGMAAQSAIVDAGDETRFYYVGNDVGNFCGTYQSGMAYLPRDRYGYRCITGYRDTKRTRKKAAFTLKPVILRAKANLTVNCDQVSAARTIRLQLRDEKGRTIPGYSFKRCRPVTKEGLRVPVRWGQGKTGRELAGRTVQIEVELFSPDCGVVYTDSPRLYAINL
jgi:hypothetical protein